MLEKALNRLAGLSQPKVWMTTKSLAKIMGVSRAQAFELLHAEYDRADRRVRYCMYPSRRDLDVLWGHIGVVGDRTLAPLTREALPDEYDSGRDQVDRLADRPGMFLSHTLRDFRAVYDLRDRLEAKGQKVWIFEDDMPLEQVIHHCIQSVLQSSEQFGVYLTMPFLDSLYGDKEVWQMAQMLEDMPFRIFFDDSTIWLVTLALDCRSVAPGEIWGRIDGALETKPDLSDRQRGLIHLLIDLIGQESCELIYHHRDDAQTAVLPEQLRQASRAIAIL